MVSTLRGSQLTNLRTGVKFTPTDDEPQIIIIIITRSSADADNRLDAFSGQSRSTNMVPFHM